MTLEFVDNHLNKKISENEEFIRFSYYELRVKNNLTDEETAKFLTLAKNKLENIGYKVYFTDAQYEFKEAIQTVQPNELLIAIK